MEEARSEPRKSKRGRYSLTWRGADGNSYAIEATGFDVSEWGVGIECSAELLPGTLVYVQSRDGAVEGDCEVIHCNRRGATFRIGFEFCEQQTRRAETPAAPDATVDEPDYYESLQINPKADAETIQRVFRIMAARFHPDNSETGDLEQFLRMKRAYSVLSNPERRAEYDAVLYKSREDRPRPVFALKDFVTGVEAEANRRLGVLCLLYAQRQTDPDHPTLSLLKLEQEMGFPREYLNFTTWYLRAKDFVIAADNADYAITAAGADYVEKEAGSKDIIGKLLRSGGHRMAGGNGKAAKGGAERPAEGRHRLLVTAPPALPRAR